MENAIKRHKTDQPDKESVTSDAEGCESSSFRFKRETLLVKNAEKLQQFLANGQLSDITLKSGDMEIKAHRNILSAASEYFEAIFIGPLKVGKNEIQLNDIQANELKLIINFCYTGQVSINDANVEPLLIAARYLQLEEIVEFCSDYIITQLDHSNCLGVSKFADVHCCQRLKECANIFTMENFDKVVEVQEYSQLSAEELCTLLSSDLLRVPCEETVFYAMFIWLKYDVTNRRQFAARLLHCIRLSYLPTKFLLEYVEKNSIIGSDPVCRDLIRKANKQDYTPRKYSPEKLYVVPGYNDIPNELYDDVLMTINCYDPKQNQWSVACSFEFDRTEFDIAIIDNKMFICGGFDRYDVNYDSVDSWDAETDIFTENVCKMNIARRGLRVAVLGNYIYAIGGSNYEQGVMSSVERWDPSLPNSGFEFIAEMSTARCNAGVAVLNDRIYMVGGEGIDWKGQQTVEWYSPDTNTWTSCAPMITGRGCLGVAVLNNLLYAVGGREKAECFNCYSSVERYDPKLDQWTLVASMSEARFGSGVIGFRDILFCFVGGMDLSKLVDCYDDKSNEWTKGADLNNLVYQPCAGVMKPSLKQDQLKLLNDYLETELR